MGKSKGSFKVTDVKRAVAAVSATGLTICGVTIATDGSIRIETADNKNLPIDASKTAPFDAWKATRSNSV